MRLNRNRFKRFLIWALSLILVGLVINNKAFWRTFYTLPYKDIIFAEAAKNNVDPFLVAAIIKVESNFTPEAESIKGARGIMQIMPETGAWAAERMKLKDFRPIDLFQIETNIKIGSWYLNNLDQEFKGNKILVVAAYNGGRGNVNDWLKTQQWSGEHDNVDQIPFEETRTYVKRVLKSYSRYRYLYGTD